MPDDAPYRRSASRVDLEVEIGFNSESNFYAGFSENLSEGGIFLATFQKLKLGDRLLVQFTLPGDESPMLVMTEVRWVRDFESTTETKPGYGLQFVDLDDGHRARIERFLGKRAPIFFEE